MRSRVPVLIASMSLLGACGGGGGTTTPPPPSAPSVSTVSVSPRVLSLAVGGTGALTAAVTSSGGSGSGITPTWSSLNGAVASVTSTGTVTGVAVGQTGVVATAGGKADTALVIVTAPFALVVAPSTASTTIGGTAQFTVQAVDPSGTPLAVTPPVTWGSTTPTIATVSAAGLATGVAAGTTGIVARSGAVVSNTALLTVSDASSVVNACFGIANTLSFDGDVTFAFAADREATNGGSTIDADDKASVKAVMTRTSALVAGMRTVQWAGDITGNASMTQKVLIDGRVDATKSGGGPISDLPNVPAAQARPKLSLSVWLDTCRYLVVAGATILVRTTQFGTSSDAVEIMGQVQFAGVVTASWRNFGISDLEPVLTPRSAVWSIMNPDKSAVIPLGFAASLFQPLDRSVGQATGSYAVTPSR